MKSKKKAILTIGGGSGSPVVNQALLLAGASYINSIAAVYDSGGATGIRRTLDTEGKEIAYSDALRILLSLIDPSRTNQKQRDVINRLLSDRNGKNQVLGHEIANRLFNPQKGFTPLMKDLEALGVHFLGQVIPSSTRSSHIKFETISGRIHTGEHLLDDLSMSKDMVTNMTLEPSVPAFDPAILAIKKASIIFLPCGSVHGSVLCNFLPEGMREAMQKTKAKIYLVTNLVSTRNETHDFSPVDYINLVKKYSGIKVDGIIVPKMTRKEFEKKYPDVAKLYDLEHSYFLGWEQAELAKVEKNGVKVITHNATKVVSVPGKETKIVRHDPKKLAKALAPLL